MNKVELGTESIVYDKNTGMCLTIKVTGDSLEISSQGLKVVIVPTDADSCDPGDWFTVTTNGDVSD